MHRQVHNPIGSFNAEKREISADLSAMFLAKGVGTLLASRMPLGRMYSRPSSCGDVFACCVGDANPSGKRMDRTKRDAERRLSRGRYSSSPGDCRPTPAHLLGLWNPGSKSSGEQYLREKQFPLWNPYNAYGTPFAAAMQPQPFFPLTALLSLHPTPWTYNIFIIARLLLAGILTFLFARLFLDYAAAVFASIAFMLNGYFIVFLGMPHLSVDVLLPGSIPYLRAFVAKDFMAKGGRRRW